MAILYITRGLPGSGKTALAREWVARDRGHRARVNRDDLRLMIDHGEFVKGVTEPRVIAARDAVILLLLGRGVSVISDDTNLPQRVARDLAALARRAGAGLKVADLTRTPLEECVARDAARGDKAPVGEAVIRDMHARFLRGRRLPLPLPEEPADSDGGVTPYVPRLGVPRAVLVDVDGTVALRGTRPPFDESRVSEDRPNVPVVAIVRSLAATHRIVFMSGRTAGCMTETSAWLCRHVVSRFDLWMRPAGDARKDSIVKRELFDRHVRDHYDVACVIDDRQQVVEMWRSLGLTVLQCAEGNF